MSLLINSINAGPRLLTPGPSQSNRDQDGSPTITPLFEKMENVCPIITMIPLKTDGKGPVKPVPCRVFSRTKISEVSPDGKMRIDMSKAEKLDHLKAVKDGLIAPPPSPGRVVPRSPVIRAIAVSPTQNPELDKFSL